MNARWTLLVAVVGCGLPLAAVQAQYPPTSQFGTQQNPQYSAQVNSQFQPASTQPTLPPTNAATYGQQGTQYTQPNGQPYPQGASAAQQAQLLQAQQQPARSSVFSTQPTVNASSQGWTGTAQPAANVTDPRYTAPQLSPPDNLQQYNQQFNAAASQFNAATTQFNNTLRDAQQQVQQFGQQAQTYGQQAQQLGQTAQDWQQQAQQYGQQVQPYLSSLTNNPYAYVPPQPQPQVDPSANQYIAGNAQTAESQFGRSVLVNNQSQPNSSFGQPATNAQYTNNNQYGTQPYGNNTAQQYGGGTQFTSNQQQQPASSFDNRGQQYPPDTNSNSRLTSGQNAFTNSSQTNSSFGSQDPRLMQTPTSTDPRYAQAQDPRNTQDPRGGLTLEPPMGSTLPAGSNQVTPTGATSQIASPYDNVQTPRADGQNNANTFSNTTGNNSTNYPLPNNQPQNNASTNFGNGTKQPEVPQIFNNMLPANGNRMANGQPYNSSQFGSSINSAGQPNLSDPDRDHLWNVLIGCLVITFASIGANFYFGWNFTEYYFRYRRLLVEGDDDDRSRDRDDDRRR